MTSELTDALYYIAAISTSIYGVPSDRHLEAINTINLPNDLVLKAYYNYYDNGDLVIDEYTWHTFVLEIYKKKELKGTFSYVKTFKNCGCGPLSYMKEYYPSYGMMSTNTLIFSPEYKMEKIEEMKPNKKTHLENLFKLGNLSKEDKKNLLNCASELYNSTLESIECKALSK